MKTSKKSLALAVILSLGVCANAWAQGTGAVQVGGGSTVPGSGADASGNYSVAIGANATASGQDSIAIGGEKNNNEGYPTIASGYQSIAMGINATASAENSIALGQNSKAIGRISFAAAGGKAIGYNAIAIGAGAQAGAPDPYMTNDYSAIALGTGASAKYSGAIAIGYQSSANGNFNMALGNGAKTKNAFSVAVGPDASATGSESTSLGYMSRAHGDYSTAIGDRSWAKLEKSTAVGNFALIYGKESTAVGYGIEVGERYYEDDDNGYIENDSHYATALGNESKVKPLVNYGTALGYKAEAKHNNSVALGANSVTSAVNSISVGSVGAERRIMNVDTAAINTDALTFNNFKYALGDDNKNYITAMVIGNNTYYFKVGETITLDKTLDSNSTNGVENQAVANADIATNNKIGDINNYSSTNYIAQGDSTVTSIGKLDAQVKTNADSITKETSERIAADKDLQEQIDNLGNNMAGNVERLDSDVKSVGAMAAAMAGLHPRFNGDGKGELAAAIGSYDGKKATAIGAFYAPDERFMFSLGGAFAAGGKKMANLGVNIALDPKPHVNKKFYEKEIADLKADVNAKLAEKDAQIEAKLAEKDAQIEALMNRLAALEARK